MLERFRTFWEGVWTPAANALLRRGVSPNLITVIGTLGVCVGALVFFPQGLLWQGVLVVTAFVFSDMIDGQMARLSGHPSAFGAFLDSTLDRFGDAAIFGGLVLYFAGPGDSKLYLTLSLVNLVMGSLTSYARARAEAAGFHAKGGIAERADRLLAILVATFAADLLGQPIVLGAMLWLLALATTATVIHRMRLVYRQALERG